MGSTQYTLGTVHSTYPGMVHGTHQAHQGSSTPHFQGHISQPRATVARVPSSLLCDFFCNKLVSLERQMASSLPSASALVILLLLLAHITHPGPSLAPKGT